jgi:hypothetical protein
MQISHHGYFKEKRHLQTEAEQHCQAKKLFRREWEYKAIGDKEQQTMTSIGVRLLQRIASLGVLFSRCPMGILQLTSTEVLSKTFGTIGERYGKRLEQLGIVKKWEQH